MKKFTTHIRNLYYALRGYFVTIDPNDNSVTLSRALFNDMRRRTKVTGNDPRIFVFAAGSSFGFAVNPPGINQPTQYTHLQHNERYNTVGFETLCPSVGNICYRLNLPHDHPTRLSISVQSFPHSKHKYYLIIPPKK